MFSEVEKKANIWAKIIIFILTFSSFMCMQVVNSVVMNHVTIGDGCSIQGSVICSNAQLQERVALKDCQVLFLSTSVFLSLSTNEYL